jgi:molybdopterin-guanine dinucleotide biosynthesis protein A
MGADKALLELGGQPLLDRVVSALAAVIPEIYVSLRAAQSGEPVRSAYPVITDEIDAIGPAAGILAAHRQDPGSAWLVLACDMPLLDERCIRLLQDGRAPDQDATCLVTDAQAAPEPLCAIYEPSTLARFQAAVDAGGNTSPRAWLAGADTRCIVVPDRDVLRGVNTAAEFGELAAMVDATIADND